MVDLDKFSKMTRLPAQHASDADCSCMFCEIYKASVPVVSELRQLRRENERLRAVAEAAKEVVAYDDPMSADLENLRYHLKSLEAPHEG